MSSQEAFGYYNKLPTLDMILGADVPGELRDESVKPMPSLVTHRLIASVDKDVFDESLGEKARWSTGDYNLYKRNCISFSAAVARDVGLAGVPAEADTLPATYLADLIASASPSNDGIWSSSDPGRRFGLSIGGPAVRWTERSAATDLLKDVTAKKGPEKRSFIVERSNTDDVLRFLGFSDAALRAEITAAGPRPSFMIVRSKQGVLEGEWHGLIVKKKANGRLDSLVQPEQVPAKLFPFSRT